MIFKQCSECKKTLTFNNKQILYRCCDAYVCSIKCSINRYKSIKYYDPELNSPTHWHNLNKQTIPSLLCNYDNKDNKDNKDKKFNKNNNLSFKPLKLTEEQIDILKSIK